ncbi:cytosolic endo-beta-N-acetylglucosaminidase isoform X2 [Leptinotarsa decemlineata]|uniref:cytosolic endo-beta-N-acetylglucosaminidase isoform X2 n=1 Tax=Leptinotarsa decemlineata TaxID=7539 RepID=UPI003D309C5C
MSKRKAKAEISEVGSVTLTVTSSELKKLKEWPEQKNCQPISNVEDLDGVIQEPPGWVDRVEILQPRSSTVLLNSVPYCHSHVNNFFVRNRVDRRTVPKTLVCHDYKGGYQSDRYLHKANEDILGNGYTFYNWAQIDIFVYFSHHFITIPPLCWINAAHKNGVKVLGTLITEFDTGNKICDLNIFKDTETMISFAKSLAALTKIFGFDGWLLNIENNVKNIDVLKEFVPYITRLIHEINPENLVIWYDSVTEKGELLWQNALNEHNRFFFDSCDGIFLNYTWSEETLMKTAEIDKFRNFDVFVGIDVFGRNMFGGGQFNTYKAAEIARRHNLSIAIFAPGWTHETLEVTDQFFEEFLNRDTAFWSSLSPYMYTHPINTYFSTDFYIGLDKRCYNMFSQQHQLSKFLHPNNSKLLNEYETIPKMKDTCRCLQVDIVDSRNVCLISKETLNGEIDYIHHLFACDLKIDGNTVVFFLTKSAKQQASLEITLIIGTCNDSFRKIVLLEKNTEKILSNATVLEVNPTESPDILNNIKCRYSRKIEEGWLPSVYLFNTPPSRILEVGASIKEGAMIHLGGFGIENADGTFLINK